MFSGQKVINEKKKTADQIDKGSTSREEDKLTKNRRKDVLQIFLETEF